MYEIIRQTSLIYQNHLKISKPINRRIEFSKEKNSKSIFSYLLRFSVSGTNIMLATVANCIGAHQRKSREIVSLSLAISQDKLIESKQHKAMKTVQAQPGN